MKKNPKDSNELELEQAKRYYKMGPEPIDSTIKEFLRGKPKAIVHGARATNAQLPSHLDKHTDDWDIFVMGEAESAAKTLESLLDERYEGNYFEVKAAKHLGTFKVVSRVTKKEVADLTVPDRHIDFRTLNGINVASLDYHVRHIKETLQDPEAAFRHDKDKETLQRIRIHQEESAAQGFLFREVR